MKLQIGTKKKKAILAVGAAAAVGAGLLLGTRMMRRNNLQENTGYEVIRQGTGSIRKDEERRSRLVVAVDTIDGCLNPAFAAAEADRLACSLIYEPLANVQTDGSLELVLAESAEWDPETFAMTVRLRPGLVFSDGSPVTAEDVCASIALSCLAEYNRDMDSPYFHIRGVWDMIEQKEAGITGLCAVDDVTAVITFLEADSRNWQVLETPVQKNYFAEADGQMTVLTDSADNYNTGTGTGAYQGSGLSRGINITLEANPNYREPAADIQRVEFSQINYYDLQQALDDGEIDVVQYTANSEKFDMLFHAKPFTVYKKPVNQIYAVGFNMNNIYLKDSRIRKIIAAAFNKEKVLDDKWENRIAPTDTIGYGTEEKAKELEINVPSYNRGEAKRMMDETGLGGKITLRFPVLENNEFQNQVAESIKNDLEHVGITVKVTPLSSDDYVRALYVEDNFDLYVYNEIMDYDYQTFYRMTQSRDGMPVAFRDNDYVELADSLKDAVDQEEYRRVLGEMTAMFYDRMPVIPFGRVQRFLSVSADLEGYTGKPDSLLLEQVHKIRSNSR